MDEVFKSSPEALSSINEIFNIYIENMRSEVGNYVNHPKDERFMKLALIDDGVLVLNKLKNKINDIPVQVARLKKYRSTIEQAQKLRDKE
ncbi:hypothetical protein KAR91_78000 [Candidatus Pacearchaeota archaeon]|nr:hypothetical protein [Candidatus Pacearchaeota archaeon]